MSSGIEKLRAEFAVIHSSLEGKYEGYIQMSDKRIEHVWTEPASLPPLETLYVDKDGKGTGVNYILEMALFDPSTKESILVRQHNDGWLHIKKSVKGAPTESYYTVKDNNYKMKLAQIWEPKPNEFCKGLDGKAWDVEEATMLLFAGFEPIAGKGGES